MYPTYPSIYGLSNTIPNSRFYDFRNMNLFLDSIASQKQLYSSFTSQTMSRLAQSASIIQGQMAASQIPLCIVQDQSGQLHQLVYMVPEHLYQSYIAAAARGMKVNLPPKLDRFNTFLPGGGATSTNDSSSKGSSTASNKTISTVATEKVVKQTTTPTSDTSDNSDGKDKKLKGITKDIVDLKNEVLKGTLSSSKTLKPTDPATIKKSIFTSASNSSTSKPLSKATPRSPIPAKSNTNVQVTVSSQPGQKNDLVSKRIYTVTPNIHGLREAHFLTNELFPLIKTNKNDIFIKNSKQLNSTDKTQFNTVSVKKDPPSKKTEIENTTTSIQNEIDLTIKPVITTETKSTSFNDKETKKTDNSLPKESNNSNTEQVQKNTSILTNNKNVNNQRNSNSEKDKYKSPSKSKSITYPERFDTSTSIDDILSQNNSDLIPKSDVESLLKCLKRKLEEKEDAERAVKRANQTVTPEPDKNTTTTKNSLFDEPGDLFSSFDGSPESEEAPSPNFFFQSRDMGSVSSVDSALSYNQQSSVSSENSDSNANNFNFLDEILAEDKYVNIDNDGRQNEIFDSLANEENSEPFVSDIGLVDTLHNHTQDNIDFSFLDNLKGNYLDCDNIFDSVDDKSGSVEAPTEPLGKDESPKSNSSSYTDNVSFPTEPAEDGDLFDHLWNELDNL